MLQKNLNQILSRFLLDDRAILWSGELELDPIFSPIGDDVASRALDCSLIELMDFVRAGIVVKTCAIEFTGGAVQYHASYWDILNGSLCMSLCSVGVQVADAIEISDHISDVLAFSYEQQEPSCHMDLTELVALVREEIGPFIWTLRNQAVSYGARDISFKLAIDLINVHARLMDLI